MIYFYISNLILSLSNLSYHLKICNIHNGSAFIVTMLDIVRERRILSLLTMETIKNIAALRFLTVHIKFFYIISYLTYNNNNKSFFNYKYCINYKKSPYDSIGFYYYFLMQF